MMLALKILIAVLTVVVVAVMVNIAYKVQELINAINALHRDISVIRLDNSRTMAELRRRNR